MDAQDLEHELAVQRMRVAHAEELRAIDAEYEQAPRSEQAPFHDGYWAGATHAELSEEWRRIAQREARAATRARLHADAERVWGPGWQSR